MKFKFQCVRFYWLTALAGVTYRVWLLLVYKVLDDWYPRPCGSQGQKSLLTGSLPKKIADPCLHWTF